MTSTSGSAGTQDHQTHASDSTHRPDGEGAAPLKFRLAGLYFPSSAERATMQSKYEVKIRESQRPDGSLDLGALPPLPPAAIPIYEGEDGKLYVLGDRQGRPVAMPFKRTRDFSAKHATEGGFLDANALRGAGHPRAASAALNRAISELAGNVAAQPGEESADAATSSRRGAGPSLGNQAVQAGIQALQGFAGQALATMLAGGTFGQFAGTFNLVGLGQMGLGQLASFASSQLMSMWAIDDSSSMGEQLAKKLTQDVVGKLQGELMSELSSGESLFNKGALEQFFTGVKPTKPQMPIARETDPTSHGGVLKSSAAKTLVNTLKPIRTLDMHQCPKCEGSTPHVGGPVREGNPTILIEGQLASRLDHAAICAGVGLDTKVTPPAANVFIGDTTVAVLAPPEPKLPGKEVASSINESSNKGNNKAATPRADATPEKSTGDNDAPSQPAEDPQQPSKSPAHDAEINEGQPGNTSNPESKHKNTVVSDGSNAASAKRIAHSNGADYKELAATTDLSDTNVLHVHAHGTVLPDGSIGIELNGKAYSAVEFATLLKQQGFDGSELNLEGCFLGGGYGVGTPFSQRVANMLDIPVNAYDTLIGVGAGGTILAVPSLELPYFGLTEFPFLQYNTSSTTYYPIMP